MRFQDTCFEQLPGDFLFHRQNHYQKKQIPKRTDTHGLFHGITADPNNCKPSRKNYNRRLP